MIDVRPCRPDEIEAVLALWDRCRSSHAVTPDSAEERLRGRGAPRITALVAFDDADATAFWEAAADPDIGRMVRTLPATKRSRS